MKISTKGRYGLRAMIELARSREGEPLLMRAITETQGIPIKYLHAILSNLKAAGLVRSVRGARGGYVLARPSGQIRVLEIMKALEGDLAVVDCVREQGACRRSRECASRVVWCELSRTIEAFLGRIKLDDLVAGRVPGCREEEKL